MRKWHKVRLRKINSQILYEVYLRRYAKYTRNKASFLVMITNRFSPQTQRFHSEKKTVARANRTKKDNRCCLIKEKNSSPNHWCDHLGETACKKTTFTEQLAKCRMKWFSESLGEKKLKKHTNEWTSLSYIKYRAGKWWIIWKSGRMSLTLKESGVWHLQTADRGLQTNPESQLLKTNRLKMGPET